MPKLELFYPIKPLDISQGFGVFNPRYKKYGFTRHNGIDYAVPMRTIIRAPFDGIVIEAGTDKSKGIFVRYVTKGNVLAEGRLGRVQLVFMHGSHLYVTQNQACKAGDLLMLSGSTGDSDGPHLHLSAFHADANGGRLRLGDPETDYSFDFSKYYNGFFAEDAQKIIGIYYRIIALLQQMLKP